MAMKPDYPRLEADTDGAKAAALSEAGFLFEFDLDLFAHRASRKIAERDKIDDRTADDLKAFIARPSPPSGTTRFLAGFRFPQPPWTRGSLG